MADGVSFIFVLSRNHKLTIVGGAQNHSSKKKDTKDTKKTTEKKTGGFRGLRNIV